MELLALGEALPVSAKAKIIEVMSLIEAWQVLNLNIRDVGEVCAKLKENIVAIKLKGTNNIAYHDKLFFMVSWS